jgi:hypothetical protein
MPIQDYHFQRNYLLINFNHLFNSFFIPKTSLCNLKASLIFISMNSFKSLSINLNKNDLNDGELIISFMIKGF